MEKLKINNLSFNFQNKKIFSNLNLTIQKEKILLLSGPSGLGKTTLAALLAGHLKPLSGVVSVFGTEVIAASKRVFLVHQENDLFAWLTVKGHLDFLIQNHVTNFAQEKIEKLLVDFKLKQFEQYYPHQLSGGMKRKLAILRAVLIDPKILIIDEALSSFDLELKNEMIKILKANYCSDDNLLIIIDHNSDSFIGHVDLVWDLASVNK